MPAISHVPVLTRRAFLSAGAGLAGGILLGGPAAATGPPRPVIHARREWRALPPSGPATVLAHAPDRLVVHHTATANEEDLSFTAACTLSLAIQRHHMDRYGWSDIGQQFTISRGGHIMEGRNGTLAALARGRHVLGAHTAGHNSHTLGIEMQGTYMSELPPQPQLAALTLLLAWLCGVYRLDPATAIVGHRDLNLTTCPGDRLYDHLSAVRSGVTGRLHARSRPARLRKEHVASQFGHGRKRTRRNKRQR